ncbi:hypothetical protein [Sodalis ligni]|uniref:Uncharacterized protein n=1 Tax=Sodalis ligni TaxID=2697027 RepID=A0A4R1N686_9GAMM|nr:hypothetical protein [Sodalis ligni]TCL02592.1 hypothetical protein EZJ58_0615 [Sodalis ligni]
MNGLSINQYCLVASWGESYFSPIFLSPTLRFRPNCVQIINGPPPCPLNILENDWNEALDDLCTNITLELWCEAVCSGFSKTNMGKSTGWLWHTALIEKFNLHELEKDDYRTLVRVLEILWNEFQQSDVDFDDHDDVYFDDDDYDYEDDEDSVVLNHLIAEYPHNTLLQFIHDKYYNYRYNYDTFSIHMIWSHDARITRLDKRIRSDFPILSHVECLHKKITRFIDHYLIRKQKEINELAYISESVIKQIEENLFQHMKEANRRHPYMDIADIVNEWDEMDLAYAVCTDLIDNDVLSTFVAFCKFADYG